MAGCGLQKLADDCAELALPGSGAGGPRVQGLTLAGWGSHVPSALHTKDSRAHDISA